MLLGNSLLRMTSASEINAVIRKSGSEACAVSGLIGCPCGLKSKCTCMKVAENNLALDSKLERAIGSLMCWQILFFVACY